MQKNFFYPDIIYVHSPTDLNIDHRIAAEAVLTAYRPQPEESYSEIRFFEIASSSDFTVKKLHNRFEPNLFINIEEFWEKKFTANINRDEKTVATLKEEGWKIGIIWECAVRSGKYLEFDYLYAFEKKEFWSLESIR